MANQIYTFLNAVTQQAMGEAAITAVDTTSLVSLGSQVLADVQSTSAFYAALASQIGRTYSLYRSLEEKRLGFERTPVEFGAILRTLEVKKIARSKANESWDNTNPITDVVEQDTTDVICTYFADRGTWSIDTKVIYDFQLREAFTDAASMAAFIDLVFQDMYNAMEQNIRNCENTTEATAITLCAGHELDTNCCINLLKAYNEAFNKTLAASAALRDEDFLRFAAAEIKKHKKYMEDPSALYNISGCERWTPSEDMQLHVLEQFAANTATYLQSSTFHDELVKLPQYRERSFWQGVGTGTTEDRAKVSVTRSDDPLNPITVTLNGVIAFCFDRDAIGIMIDYIRTRSDYKPKFEHTEYYHKADWGSFVRPTQQMCVFYIDDYAPVTVSASDVTNWASVYANYYTKNADGTYTAATSTYSATTQYYKKVN